MRFGPLKTVKLRGTGQALLLLQKNDSDDTILLPVLVGLISMGLLDGAHALTDPGKNFILYHSFTTLFGGLCFALNWLPKRAFRKQLLWLKQLPILATLLSVLLIVWSVLDYGRFPDMQANGRFTSAAIVMHVVGGFFFFVGSLSLFISFHRSKKIKLFLFANIALLLAAAALIFHPMPDTRQTKSRQSL